MLSKLRGPRHLRAAISVFASLLLVVGVAGFVLGATSHDGTMTVSSTSLVAGATGQTLTFDFGNNVATTFAGTSRVEVTIPAGWTAPTTGQLSATTAGATTTAFCG